MSEDDKEKNLPEVKLEAYKDIAQPAARILGVTLGKCVGLALNPVGALADIGRKNLMRFVKKLEKEEKENPENIIPTKPSVAIPILEKMRYIEEDVLAEAYAELLKNGCLKDRQAKVHPTYSEILSRLTSDEVKTLDFLYHGGNTYKIPMQELVKVLDDEDKQMLEDMNMSAGTLIPLPVHGIPFLEVRGDTHKENEGWVVMAKYFTDISRKIAFSSPENLEVYIDNLQSLGIFQVRTNLWFIPVVIYNDLESEATHQYKRMIEGEGRKMRLIRGEIRLTSLALSFLEVCTSSKDNKGSNVSAP